ncbi:MAG TPA: alpha-L-rhamnosidase C-terminal domain-containing protein, partial [Bacteroidales bacterium]|nr:alpha-L-rhamnosidase C-terminal domain-containing protein [Bacteroidales bacterium]
PFRYCEVENYAASLVPSDISRRSYHYLFDEESSFFTSSDTILNSVSDICRYSIKATSFAGLYIDGDRERIPYEADAYINQLGHYYSDREYSIARRTNEYFIDHPTWPTEWILHTIPMFYNDLMFTGNTESVRQYYDKLRYKTLTLLAREDGLISSKNITPEIMKALGFSDGTEQIRDIVDWPPAQKDTGWKLATPEGERDGYELVEVNTVVNAFYIHTLKLMSEIARMLNKDDDAVYYSVEAKRTEKSFNEKLLDKTSGIYTDGIGSGHSSLHANMLPLAFGLVPEEYKTKVTAFVKSRGMACSVYGSQYLLEGLYNAGEADYALDLMTSTGDRSWWNMIKSGSTITLEAWDMKYKPNSDWNHAWGAAPANIIPGYLWGIKPVEPGWKKAVIKPQPGILSSGEIKVPTIRGTISASFRKEGKSTLYLITLPGNINCDFITPSGIVKLRPGLNRIKI